MDSSEHEHTRKVYARGHLPDVIDEIASSTPDKIWAEHPIASATYDQGFSTIDYSCSANGINCVALWLVETLGYGENFETLA